MKKGDYMFVAGLILAIAVLVILFSFSDLLGGELLRSGDRSSCQAWVSFRSSEILGLFSGKGADDSCVTYEEDVKTTNQEELFSTLAKDMLSCWRDYGSGKVDFYSDLDWGVVEDTYCRVCSQKNFKKKATLDMKAFQEYLNNNGPDASGKKYSEILTDIPGGKLNFNTEEMEFDEKNPLYISFVVDKGLLKFGTYTLSSGLVGGTALTVVAAKTGIGGAILSTLGISVATGVGALVVGAAVVGIIVYDSYGDDFTPGILLMDSTGLINVCDDVYYNVENKEIPGFTDKLNSLDKGNSARKTVQ